MRLHKSYFYFIIIIVVCAIALLVQGSSVYSKEDFSDHTTISYLRDSLDAVNYSIPSLPSVEAYDKVMVINTQKEWDELFLSIKKLLANGSKNILIKVSGNNLVYGKKDNTFNDLIYPDANIRIVGNQGTMIPDGVSINRFNSNVDTERGFYSYPYTNYEVNDMVLDSKGDEIPFREPVKQIHGDIEECKNVGADVWRFRIDLPDLNEDSCQDFYVLLTREWTSGRHKVIKVKDGWLYFHLETDDIEDDRRNPNVDWTNFHVRPRYCLINSPVSSGVHVLKGRIYIPKKYWKVRVIKGGCLIHFYSCQLNSLVISDFTLNGCRGMAPISIYSCTFGYGAFIHDNTITNISGLAISTGRTNNVTVSNNFIQNSREGAIECSGEKTTICGNHLKNIGWMLNTRAIIGGGDQLHICDNIIEDFNYAAINCGRRIANRDDFVLNYIVERNVVRLSKEYSKDYLKNTLADGGGIYIGPQCTRGIIRNNVVENIKGIHSNRGIFLDDGAKNLAIYGNLIINTANSHDIDLRFTDSFAEMIPDHNTNNSVFQNIITGGYRFQGGEGITNTCMGGNNLLLNIKEKNKITVNVDDYTPDVNLERCKYKRGKLVISKRNKAVLDSLCVDPYIREYLNVKN